MKIESKLFERLDRVRHAGRPEWGVGIVQRAEVTEHEGRRVQRLTIDFEHQGRAVINTALAPILPAEQPLPLATLPSRSKANTGWLGDLDDRNCPGSSLTALPDEVDDPFTTPIRRLKATLALYRFNDSPHGLIDWAVAQTGLSDPLSEYSRHDLEQAFRKFAQARETHLRLLVDTMRRKGQMDQVRAAAQEAPTEAQAAIRRAMH